MRERGIKVIRGLLWLMLICLGAPLTLRFLGLAFDAVARGRDGTLLLEAAVALLPLGACAAATVTTLWRLEGWSLPGWWWIALMAGWVTACAAGLTYAGELTTLPLLTSAAMMAFHVLWTLLRAGRMKETEESR